MNLGIGSIRQKTDSFSKIDTELDDFTQHEHLMGGALIANFTDTPTVLGGALRAANDANLNLFPLVATSALPGGRVRQTALEAIVDELMRALADRADSLDGLLLELHGSMVAEHVPTADEYVVQRVREAYPNLPFAVVLESQANLTPGLVSNADVVLGYDPYAPHSAAERGKDAVSYIRRIVDEGVALKSEVVTVPMMIPLQAQYAGRSPMRELRERAKERSGREGVCEVSIFSGFPLADTAHSGASVVAVGRRGDASARTLAEELAQEVREKSREFSVVGYNVEEAVHNAIASKNRPVVLADLGDNPGNGAPGDGTTLLWALLDLGVRQATLATIVDPAAVDACIRAGIGSRMEIPLGGRMDTRQGYSIDVEGYVRNITDGTFTNEGPLQAGLKTDLGRTVLLELEARHDGHVEVIVCEKRAEPSDVNVFRHVGIEPTERQILAVKSDVRLRENYRDIAVEIYDVIAPGITTPDPAFYEYQNVRRPIFPLDSI